MTTTLQTPESLKAKFEREGKTFSGWAEDRGYTRQEVYRVVNGFVKARRGKSHRIAVELGLKAPGTDSSALILPDASTSPAPIWDGVERRKRPRLPSECRAPVSKPNA